MALRASVGTHRTLYGLVWFVTAGLVVSLRADPFPLLRVPSAMEQEPNAAAVHRQSRPAFLGSQSCAAVSCHGNTDRTDLLSSAYHFVMDADPHTRAGLVLYSRASRDMVERLGVGRAAWKADQCLVCHAPGAVMTDTRSVSHRVADGVGCESCHGAATDWLSAHRSRDWTSPMHWPAERKTAAGFVNTKDLTTRIGICADCHIGNADQQVTHDMIAAGHPRLSYEFTAYHAMLPPHWDRTTDRVRLRPPYEDDDGLALKSWLLGQLVTAERHLTQVESSARHPDAVWPELAHLDCFACHHDLADPSWRQSQSSPDLKPGQAAWGTWTLGLLASVPEELIGWNASDVSGSERELRQLMQSYSNDREGTAQLAGRLRLHYTEAINRVSQVPIDADTGDRLTAAFLQDETNERGNWDRAAQLFLAVAALQHDTGHEQIDQAALLDAIRRHLAFEVQSRGQTTPNRFSSPSFKNGKEEISTKKRVRQLFQEYLRYHDSEGTGLLPETVP